MRYGTTVAIGVGLAVLGLVLGGGAAWGQAAAGDWPTVHHDVARSAYTTDSPAPPFHRKWVYTGAVLENIDTWAEAIVSGDKVFVGTYAGNLYALDRDTGAVKWTYPAGNLIVGSPAVDGGTVYVGSLGDLARPGYIHAVDPATGQRKWRFEAPGGFWTSPCCYKGLVLMGARDGVFYAVDAQSGLPKWRYTTPRPILTTAAATGDTVLLASEDGRAYCLNLADGSLKWKSDSLLAITLRGYYPMIWGDTALFVTMPAILALDSRLRDEGEDMLGTKIGGETVGVRSGHWKKKAVAGVPPADSVAKERQAILDWLAADPRRQAAWALKLTDGKPKFPVPIIWHAGNMGLQNAGCVSPDGWFSTAAASYFNNWRDTEAYGPVRVNSQDGRLEILDWAAKDPRATPGFGTTFEYDEAYNFTAGGKRIYFTHQDNVWGLDLDGNVGFNIAGDRDKYGGIYGGFNSPFAPYLPERGGTWLEVGGVKVYSSPNQWHGTGQGTMAVSGQDLFWITGGMVICLESGPAAASPAERLSTGPGPAEAPAAQRSRRLRTRRRPT